MAEQSLGTRMKEYEDVTRDYLIRRVPVIIRIDGKAFHTFTKGLEKPFDELLMGTMWQTSEYLCRNIQGCKLAYTQSDEISLLLTDYDTIKTDGWFDYNIQKMVSVSASMATLAFNKFFKEQIDLYQSEVSEEYFNILESKIDSALFDSRVFNLPKEEVTNYFIWRQQDATRNSIQALAQSVFPHKQIQGIGTDMLQDAIFKKTGQNWNNLPIPQKRGVCIKKYDMTMTESIINTGETTVSKRPFWNVDLNIPIFTQDRDYIEQWIEPQSNKLK